MSSAWRQQAEAELAHAATARLDGSEGRARVCARRAAGMAARDFLGRHGVRSNSRSAYEALQTLAELPDLAPDLRQAALHLTMRVAEDFTLPAGVDLIAEARTFCERLGDLS
jgi:hypothetical protein